MKFLAFISKRRRKYLQRNGKRRLNCLLKMKQCHIQLKFRVQKRFQLFFYFFQRDCDMLLIVFFFFFIINYNLLYVHFVMYYQILLKKWFRSVFYLISHRFVIHKISEENQDEPILDSKQNINSKLSVIISDNQ